MIGHRLALLCCAVAFALASPSCGKAELDDGAATNEPSSADRVHGKIHAEEPPVAVAASDPEFAVPVEDRALQVPAAPAQPAIAANETLGSVTMPGPGSAPPEEEPDARMDWPGLPQPVSLVADGAKQQLKLNWQETGVSVAVEIPMGAIDPGTEVTLLPLPAQHWEGRLPGVLVDDIGFRLLPHGLEFDSPVMVTVYYQTEITPDERYALLYWNQELNRHERMPIAAQDAEADFVSYYLDHFSDFSMVYTLVEGLYLEKSGGGWKLHMYFEGWPGLVSAKVKAAYDGGGATISNPETGTFDADSVGFVDIAISGGGGGYGWHDLDIWVEIEQSSGDDDENTTKYDMDLWKQGFVSDWPTLGDAAATELLTRFAPIFHFAEDEKYFPVSLDKFVDLVTEVRMPSGRVHYLGPGEAWSDLGILGDERAAMVYKGKSIEKPMNASEGTVYGHAFDVGNGTVALTYIMYFPWSQDLGPQYGSWGGHRGDIKYVVILVSGTGADATPLSMTMSEHKLGTKIEYLGDEDQEIWTLGSWNGGRLTVPWEETLRCKRFGGDAPEEHPWVFVAKDSHALYPRAGTYRVSIVNKASVFEEVAGKSKYLIWQPPEFKGACQIMKQYDLLLHPKVGELSSGGEDGYLLFSGKFGGGRFGRNGFAPYGQAWTVPQTWVESASTGTFDEGTNCYKCVPFTTLQTIKGMSSIWCYMWMWICQCGGACGAVDGDAFLHFPEGFECNDPQFCDQFGLDGLCKSGLTVEWYSAEPFNGWVNEDKDLQQHAKVWVIIPYAPTCYMSALSGTGVKTYTCASDACCTEAYGYVEGECYATF